MSDEARLNDILDVMEQAKKEGDMETFNKANALYQKESAPPATKETPWYAKPLPILGIPLASENPLQDLKRGAGLGARSIINAVTALPNAAMDAGMAVRNALPASRAVLWDEKTKSYKPDPNAEPIEASNYELPSQTLRSGLTEAGLPEPQGMAEKGADIATQMLIGSRLPAPQAGTSETGVGGNVLSKTATNYQPVSPVRLESLKAAQDAGYVVPPSTTNPTVTNKVLESIGGKVATAQDAATRNQAITDSLAKKSLGLPDDAPLTKESLEAIRSEAGQVYESLRGIGTMRADSKYTQDLQNILAKYKGAEKSFPELAKSEVTDLVEGMNKKSFDSDSAVDMLKILREKASKAYASGDSAVGGAYRSVSKALENAMERSLERRGDTDLLDSFKGARAAIARTYSVENAFNQASGNVSAIKMGAQYAKNKPLGEDLAKIGRFGQAFPKAGQLITDSGPVRNTDVMIGAGTSALSREPTWLLYPFARMATRDALLSKLGQRLAQPSLAPADLSPQAMSTAQLIQNLMSQPSQ